MRMILVRSLALLALATAPSVQAQQFQLIVTVSPPGSNANPASWQPTLRIGVNGSGGTTFPLTSIPSGEVFDPAGIAFRSATDLFVGNRHGNVLGTGSISRFTLSPDGAVATQTGNFTAPGMIGVHELAYDATRDQLFATAVNNGIFRFRFDGAGNPILMGSFAAGRLARGVAVHPNGGFLYMTSASGTISRFALTGENDVTELPPLVLPGASNLHFFCVSPDARHLFASDIGSNAVFRLRLGSQGDLTLDQTTPSPAAIDLAFSPDYTEMFVGNHFGGGITRYRSDANQNWIASGSIETPSMGGFGIYVAPGCIVDFNFDGAVDPDDLADFIGAFFLIPPNPRTEYNGDGVIDPDDLADFIGDYFNGCP